jgi:hypothetical protein
LGYDASNVIVGEDEKEQATLAKDGIFAYMDKDDN